jgi:hypothetical protein
MRRGRGELPTRLSGRPADAILPDGVERQSESSGKSKLGSGGAAESAAINSDLVIVIGAWPLLAPHLRAIIVDMARDATAKASKRVP